MSYAHLLSYYFTFSSSPNFYCILFLKLITVHPFVGTDCLYFKSISDGGCPVLVQIQILP